jgi:hypothetical protein
MATTIILITVASICEKHNITPEQFDKGTYCVTNGKGFYIVESQTTDAEYHCSWNAQYNVLQCSCPAVGKCWHMRSAVANQEYFKAQRLARRQAEQAEIESSPAYQAEQLVRAMEELEVLHEELVASQR